MSPDVLRAVDNPVDAWGRRPVQLWTAWGSPNSHACEMRTAGDNGGREIAVLTCDFVRPSTIHSTYYRYRQILKKNEEETGGQTRGRDRGHTPVGSRCPRSADGSDRDHLRLQRPAHPKGRHR
jgi:hypothetical protein